MKRGVAAVKTALFAAVLCASAFVHAQSGYPVRPVTIIVPLSAGSASDVAVRTLAERLRGTLGQQ